MATLTVGPNSTYPTIASAMAAAGASDTILLESGYSNETATVTQNGMIVTGDATSTGIVLQLATGIATFTLAGAAPIDVRDAADGNGIVGNDGDNVVTVTAGADAVQGGLGSDRLVVDYRLATGAVTGDSTSNVAEAGGGGRLVTINGGFEDFTILTGSGADTITTGAGDDIIDTGDGAGTVTAGQGANSITGGSGADTITALDGGNFIDGGDGTNTLTSGGGNDVITGGVGADTIVAAGGNDLITVRGGADTSDSGAGSDRLVVDYSASATAVSGGVTGGNLPSGYVGRVADLVGNAVDFQGTETFSITTGAGNDSITTGDGMDMLNGGLGDDVLSGGGGNDTIAAGGGVDVLNGGTGNDVLSGDAGDDTIAAGDGADRLNGGLGNDVLSGDAGKDKIAAGDGIDMLNGGIGRDVLDGGGGRDALNGGVERDLLDGGAGADTLVGGLGKDRMDGGSGPDSFVFNALAESGSSAKTRDVIRGFDHADTVDLSALDANTRKAGNQAFSFGDSFTGSAGELQWDELPNGNFVVEADVNGDRVADFSLRMNDVGRLQADDFML